MSTHLLCHSKQTSMKSCILVHSGIYVMLHVWSIWILWRSVIFVGLLEFFDRKHWSENEKGAAGNIQVSFTSPQGALGSLGKVSNSPTRPFQVGSFSISCSIAVFLFSLLTLGPLWPAGPSPSASPDPNEEWSVQIWEMGGPCREAKTSFLQSESLSAVAAWYWHTNKQTSSEFWRLHSEDVQDGFGLFWLNITGPDISSCYKQGPLRDRATQCNTARQDSATLNKMPTLCSLSMEYGGTGHPVGGRQQRHTAI